MHNNSNALTADHRSAQILDLLKNLGTVTGRNQYDERFNRTTCEAARTKLVQIARAAREGGFSTYCSIALHVLEQVWPMSRTGYLSIQLSNQIRTWTALSIRHFEKPTSWPRIVALVDFLSDHRWERPVGPDHLQSLLIGLKQDWSPTIEEFDPSTGVFPTLIKGAA